MKWTIHHNPEETRRTLARQEIAYGEPGTILKDITTVIDFIENREIKTSSKRGNLPMALLGDLNQRVSDPIDIDLNRPLLKDYPNLAGLYALLRVTELVRPVGRRIQCNPQALERWRSLNPTEQYFTLLEAWLFYAEETVLGINPSPTRFEQFGSNLRFLEQLRTTNWTHFDDFIHAYQIGGGIAAWNAFLQHQFGLAQIERRNLKGLPTSTGGRGWILKKAKRTDWGTAIHWVVSEMHRKKGGKPHFFDQGIYEAGFGTLKPSLQPYFPDWRSTFSLDSPQYRPGVYRFKVTPSPASSADLDFRRLTIPSDYTLHELSQAILDAFEFIDWDHPYFFKYRDRLGKLRTYFHPYCDMPSSADTIVVGQAELPYREAVHFRFDFGAKWDYELKLEEVKDADPGDR